MKRLIRKWLGIDELVEKNEALSKRVDLFREHAKQQRERADKAEAHAKRMERLAIDSAENAKIAKLRAEQLGEMILVGVDINPTGYDKSWAVVCIKGKLERVEFVDLTEKDAREIQRFLSIFKRENVRVDAPLGMKFF